MAIGTPTQVAVIDSTSNATSYATASFAVTTGGLLVIFAWPTDTANSGGNFAVSGTHTGIAFTERLANTGWNTLAASTRGAKVWTAQGQSGSGTLTFDTFTDGRTGFSARIIEVPSGFDATTPIVQTPVLATDGASSTHTLTFSAAASADNLFIAGIAKAGSQVLVGEGGTWTTLGTEGGFGTPNQRSWTQYDLTSPDTTSTWTWATSTQDCCQMGVEVAVDPPAPSTMTASVGFITKHF